MHYQKTQGITLLELVLSLLLISILAAFALPAYYSQGAYSQEMLFQKQLQHIIQTAQRETIKHDHVIGICGSINGRSCSATWLPNQLIFLDAHHEKTLPDVDPASILHHFQNKQLQGVLCLRAYPGYRHYVRVSALHQMDNATFWYCDQSHAVKWALSISRTGEIRSMLPHRDGQYKDSKGYPLYCDC